MKVVRILQVIGILVVAVYLYFTHLANPDNVNLPLLFLPLPTVVVIVMVLMMGWGLGWVAGQRQLWRLQRENRKLRRRILELERTTIPTIPDREAARSGFRRPQRDKQSADPKRA